MILTREQIKFIIDRNPEYGWEIIEQFLRKIQPQITSGDVEQLYDLDYNKILENHPCAYFVKEKYRIHIFEKYAFDWLKENVKVSDSILEVGCGKGDLLCALSSVTNNNVAYIGVDFSEYAIDKARMTAEENRLNCKFYCIDVNNFETDGKFDYIVLNDVIEHLNDREISKMLEKFSLILQKNGLLIMHTPNGMNICAQSDESIYSKIYFKYLKLRGYKFTKSVEQVYYEQVHINVKSFRQWKRFFKKWGYQIKVMYDEQKSYKVPKLGLVLPPPIWQQTTGNMLLIAHFKGKFH